MKRSVLIVIAVLMVLASTIGAFDGNRKGFVMGGGIGFAPSAGWKFNDSFLWIVTKDASENQGGGTLNLYAGYAWDEKNMIVYEVNAAGYSSDSLQQNITQTYTGPVWYHYYGMTGKSFYSTVGLGLYFFDGEHFDALDPGPGLLLGGGYEFARHFQAGLYLAFGTISELGVDVKLHHVGIVINAVAF